MNRRTCDQSRRRLGRTELPADAKSECRDSATMPVNEIKQSAVELRLQRLAVEASDLLQPGA